MYRTQKIYCIEQNNFDKFIDIMKCLNLFRNVLSKSDTLQPNI